MKKSILLIIIFLFSINFVNAQWTQIYSNASVYAIAFAPNGDSWIKSTSGGIVKNLTQAFNLGMPSSDINDVAVDGNGIVWVATNNGLAKYDGSSWSFYTTSNSNIQDHYLSEIAIDNNNNIWLGGLSSLLKYDGTSFTQYFLPSNAYINALCTDKNSNVWIGTNGNGLMKFDGVNFNTYTTTSFNPNDILFSIIADSSNNIWMACHNPNGLYSYGVAVFDGSIFTHYSYSNTSGGLADDWVVGIAIDKNGSKWFATYGGGVSKFNNSSWTKDSKYTSSLPDNYEGCIKMNYQTNCIWVGANSFDGSGIATYCMTNGVNEIFETDKFSIYPNPSSEQITLKAGTITNGKYLLELRNTLGQVLKIEEADVTNHTIEKQISITSFADGIYMLSIKGNDVNITKKVQKIN